MRLAHCYMFRLNVNEFGVQGRAQSIAQLNLKKIRCFPSYYTAVVPTRLYLDQVAQLLDLLSIRLGVPKNDA